MQAETTNIRISKLVYKTYIKKCSKLKGKKFEIADEALLIGLKIIEQKQKESK